MDQRALFLQFWNNEAAATRKVIARIPEDRSDYRPHPESRSARELAWLIVLEEQLLVEGLETGTLDWREEPMPDAMADILRRHDAQHPDVTARLEQLPAEAYDREVRFEVGGQVFRTGTGIHYAWEFLFDQVHHRGQLSTYLRPMGARVPSIYGPSGDEQS